MIDEYQCGGDGQSRNMERQLVNVVPLITFHLHVDSSPVNWTKLVGKGRSSIERKPFFSLLRTHRIMMSCTGALFILVRFWEVWTTKEWVNGLLDATHPFPEICVACSKTTSSCIGVIFESIGISMHEKVSKKVCMSITSPYKKRSSSSSARWCPPRMGSKVTTCGVCFGDVMDACIASTFALILYNPSEGVHSLRWSVYW